MAIQFKDFTCNFDIGAKKDYKQEEAEALRSLNSWLEDASNAQAQVINIETLVKQTSASMVGIESRDFIALRVWFRNPAGRA